MEDGPVSMRRTIRKSSIFHGFECNGWISRGAIYISCPAVCVLSWLFWKLPWHTWASLLLYLSLFCYRLHSCECESTLVHEFEFCGTRKSSSKCHRLVTLRSCHSVDSLEKVNSWSPSRRLWRCPELVVKGCCAHLAEVVKGNSRGIEV